MKCPVCDNVNTTMVCPQCGFDSSQDYGMYPTFGPVKNTLPVSVLRKEWQEKQKPAEQTKPVEPNPVQTEPPAAPQKKRKLLPLLIAAAFVLTLGLGVWIGGILFDGASNQWRENVLRSDAVLYQHQDHWDQDDEARSYPVFGSGYKREQIKSVTILDTLMEAPVGAWDVSASGNDSVMAWVKRNGELYDLYIGAEGGINAKDACKDLFAGYANAERITLGSAFHTENVMDMSRMFFACFSLKELTLSSFDTGKVKDMSYMFCYCQAMKKLNVNGFDTGNVQDMRSMFSWCRSLEGLSLSSFETVMVRNMKEMFYCCESLKYLDISEFDTTNVQDMTDMFYNCTAGDDWQHLLH